MTARLDEFAWIDLLKPLTRGDSRALDLADDAAVIPARPGFDLVISKDAMVEGVHFPVGEAPSVVARRLLRTSLSDLAAKAAEPFGYFLMTAWPPDRPPRDQHAFIEGLDQDGAEFGVVLLGGDTVSTPGPLTLSATVLGWAPAGKTVPRSGARAGDLLLVCGVIGDGWLGLRALRGEVADPAGDLASHYRAPRPLFALRDVLRAFATAAADVSDGLLADAGHIAEASGLAARLDLELAPVSPAAAEWRNEQADRAAATLALATGGDDYAIVCAVNPANHEAFKLGVTALGIAVACIGALENGRGISVWFGGKEVRPGRLGWRH
jgi:thiamine-monophosphate kinase